MASESSHCDDDETEILQFNLTNSDKLTKQLDAARLDDEETDALLKEARRINKQLKETLRLQQLEESSEDGLGASKTGLPSSCPTEPPAPRNPKQSILPPIVNSGRSTGSGSSIRGHRDHKTKSLKDTRFGSGSKNRGKPTPPDHKVKRPAWDDRFSFG